MIKREHGFTLVELMITMVVFVFVMAAASNVLTGLLTQFKQQSKMAETNIEGIVGLEILRQDIEHAGYGLPWNVMGITDADADGNFWEHLAAYYEATSTGSAPDPASFNDGTSSGTNGNPPRAILSGNDVGLNNADYLVIKSVNVASNFTAGKWQPLHAGSDNYSRKTWWASDREYVCRNDAGDHYPDARVIIISPGSTDTDARSLVVSGGVYYTSADNFPASFAPATGDTATRIMYGVDPTSNLRMPFNRADYYISTSNVPGRCASNTGVLMKGVVNNSTGSGGGNITTFLPLLDCVADMQVVYQLDMDGDGTAGTTSNADGSTVGGSESATVGTVQATFGSAADLRNRVKEVLLYILAHEGQRDPNYTYPTSTVAVPAALDPGFGFGSSFDFSSHGITDWQNYRWKLYTIAVKPTNLR